MGTTRTITATEGEWLSVMTGFFIDRYRLNHIAEAMNRGERPDKSWEPHWGQRVQAQADAEQIIERMRARQTEQATERTSEPTKKPCGAFEWIGQTLRSCDGCGLPAWEHDRQDTSNGKNPWATKIILQWFEDGLIDKARVSELMNVVGPL